MSPGLGPTPYTRIRRQPSLVLPDEVHCFGCGDEGVLRNEGHNPAPIARWDALAVVLSVLRDSGRTAGMWTQLGPGSRSSCHAPESAQHRVCSGRGTGKLLQLRPQGYRVLVSRHVPGRRDDVFIPEKSSHSQRLARHGPSAWRGKAGQADQRRVLVLRSDRRREAGLPGSCYAIHRQILQEASRVTGENEGFSYVCPGGYEESVTA